MEIFLSKWMDLGGGNPNPRGHGIQEYAWIYEKGVTEEPMDPLTT